MQVLYKKSLRQVARPLSEVIRHVVGVFFMIFNEKNAIYTVNPDPPTGDCPRVA